MGKYILAHKAVDDLSKIWDYIFKVWSELQAERYYYMLLDSCQELFGKKVFGKNYHEVEESILGLKMGQHSIFYRNMKGNNIEITRILYSRMDFKNKILE